MTTPLLRLAPERQRVVRDGVRDLLESSSAFGKLDRAERVALAKRMVDVVAFLADPEAGVATGASVPQASALAQQPAANAAVPTPVSGGAPPVSSERPSARRGELGQALRAGADAYRDLTSAVDFPKFVAGLIDGVFHSIVDASIRQMDAYGKLLEGVTMSLEDFAKDNFTLNQGRDYLVERFPRHLAVDTSGASPRLAPTPQADSEGLDMVKKALGMTDEVDLSDDASEAELARRAQLEMARLRQKQLSTMVLLGINRIIVTDGLINAKVVIDVKANDKASKKKTASSFDDTTATTTKGGGGWFSSSEDTVERHSTLVKSALEETNDSVADAKAKLSGEVRVNFKSETFPLEKLASQTQIESLNDRSRP